MENTWSKQQTAIFDFFARGKGNLVVRARAGTGKTTTILEACGYAPHTDKILLAAFNKRIAVELTNRVTASNVEAKTLHSLGFSYIRRHWNNVKIDVDVDFSRANAAFGRVDAPDEMVKLVAKLAGLLKSIMPFEMDAKKVNELAVEFDLVPEEAWEEEGWSAETICEVAIKARDAAKVRDEQGRISFDDMIFIPLANGFARAWYDLVVIDEAQDMNYAQLLLARRACRSTGRVVVVGDDRQAIYGFRGADAGGLDRLKKELEAAECGLTTTYRCAKSIVRQAQEYVGDFKAAETNPEGIVDRIPTGDALIKAARPGDFILSRANAPLMSICLAFLKKGVKARIEGRDVGATLRGIVNGFKAKSVPNFIERVEGWREKQTKRTLKIKKESVKEQKIDTINDQADMLSALAEGCVSVQEISKRVDTLFGDSEAGAPQNAIVCSSIHRAKGLEADRVFVLEETVRDDNDEECNIAYVAYTRGKFHLTLVGERKPKKKGRGSY